VKFHDDEGVANHIDLEPCAAAREGGREASAEGRIGQPLSRERTNIRSADDILESKGNTLERAIASAQAAPRGRRTWHVQKLPGGVDGAKGRDQGKGDCVHHAPNTGSGKRVTGARSSTGKQHG